MYVGRYAPSPTGDLHIGNAFAAVCAWARARRRSGVCLLRIEDVDTPRVVAGARERIEADLSRLGLGFAGAVVVQSARTGAYEHALAQLRAAGLLYACKCSRKDLQRAASAPHEGEEGPPYPGTCRELALPFDDPALPVAWRFRVPPGVVTVDDELQGTFAQDVAAEVGDFVLRRKDGLYAYQLAVVVDDAHQGVTEVVRGRDLLASAPRQVLLFRALGFAPPAFAHLPLAVDASGARWSKRHGDSPALLSSMWARGVTTSDVLASIAAGLGLPPRAAWTESALADALDDRHLRRATVALALPSA